MKIPGFDATTMRLAGKKSHDVEHALQLSLPHDPPQRFVLVRIAGERDGSRKGRGFFRVGHKSVPHHVSTFLNVRIPADQIGCTEHDVEPVPSCGFSPHWFRSSVFRFRHEGRHAQAGDVEHD